MIRFCPHWRGKPRFCNLVYRLLFLDSKFRCARERYQRKTSISADCKIRHRSLKALTYFLLPTWRTSNQRQCLSKSWIKYLLCFSHRLINMVLFSFDISIAQLGLDFESIIRQSLRFNIVWSIVCISGVKGAADILGVSLLDLSEDWERDNWKELSITPKR